MKFISPCWQVKLLLEGKQPKIYQVLDKSDIPLKVSFTSTSCVNNVPPSGSVTLVGLELEDLEYLATSFMPQSGKLKAHTVEISAGWDGTMSLVLYGNVMKSIPDFTNPNYSIKLDILNGTAISQANKYLSMSYKGTITLRDVLANLAKKNDYILEIDSMLSNYVLKNYSFQGPFTRQIESLRHRFPDIEFSLDKKNTIKVFHKKTVLTTKYKLTPSSGLLGSPKPTATGCELQCYMLPNLYAHEFIELEANKLHNLNAVYKVVSITHTGDTIGQAWYTSLTCQNVNLI